METKYDSTKDTQGHILRVRELLDQAQGELHRRGEVHDKSKLEEPEKSYFDIETPILKDLVYGSTEYKESTERLKPATEHHYSVNSHHPQHYENGVNDMNLFDVMEMFFDWKASGERGKDGNIYKSIEMCSQRYGISKQLNRILVNTAKYLGYE